MAIFIRYPKDAQTSQPIKFDLDGVITDVHQDTGVPANSTPLPVSVVDGSGVIVGFATEVTLANLDSKVTAVDTDNVTVVSSVLPTGAATEATLSSIDTKLTAPISVDGPLTDAELRASAVPVSAASLPLPTGAATEAKQDTGNTSLSSIDGKVPANLTVTATRLLVDPSGVTSPVSVASLPLPTGAATEATLSSIDGKVPANLTVTATRLLVDGSGVTQPVSAVSLPLPTGAATEAKQDTGNTSLSSIDTKLVQTALNYGAATGAVRVAAQIGNASAVADFGAGNSSAQTVRVVIATDQAAVQVSAAKNANATFSQNASLSTVVTESAPSNAVGFILFADSGNSDNLRFCSGATASASNGIPLEPGRDSGFIPLGKDLSLCAVSGTLKYYLQWVRQ